jgi:hypothetical protein
MKFVILSRKPIPGYGVSGPILTPATYDIHLVLRWISAGVDVREVMEDGSYRRLSVNDKRILEELNKKIDKKAAERKALKERIEREAAEPKVMGNVKLVPEKTNRKPKVKKVVEPKPEEVVNPVNEKPIEVKEEPLDFIIDELERPE